MSAVPRDPRDVRSGDAQIGQFAVAELVKLFQARVVAPPGPEEVDDCGQHGCYLSPGPVLGVVRITPMSLRRGKCIVSIAGVGRGFSDLLLTRGRARYRPMKAQIGIALATNWKMVSAVSPSCPTKRGAVDSEI